MFNGFHLKFSGYLKSSTYDQDNHRNVAIKGQLYLVVDKN